MTAEQKEIQTLRAKLRRQVEAGKDVDDADEKRLRELVEKTGYAEEIGREEDWK